MAPSITVSVRDFIDEKYSPISMAWCVHVTEIPEDTNRMVFRKGIPFGSKQVIPRGGHTPPNSTAGDSAK